MRSGARAGLTAAAAVAGLALACAGAVRGPGILRPGEQPIRPLDAEAPRLAQVPYDQPFAWVKPSRLFAGVHPIDEDSPDDRLYVALRESISIPLQAVGWYEVPDSAARYFVTVLIAERTEIQQRLATNTTVGQGRATGTTIPVGRTFRAFAIGARSGSIAWRVSTADRWTVERQFGEAVIELVMGKLPDRESGPR